jgi:uncharacterized membrane protein
MKKLLILIGFFIVFLCIIEPVTANDFVSYVNNFTFYIYTYYNRFINNRNIRIIFFVIKYETSKAKSKILKERYTKGKITKEEYKQMKKNLEN